MWCQWHGSQEQKATLTDTCGVWCTGRLEILGHETIYDFRQSTCLAALPLEGDVGELAVGVRLLTRLLGEGHGNIRGC